MKLYISFLRPASLFRIPPLLSMKTHAFITSRVVDLERHESCRIYVLSSFASVLFTDNKRTLPRTSYTRVSNYRGRVLDIGTHSAPIRNIPNHFKICIQSNANQSEPIQKKFSISFVEKRFKINQTQSDAIREFFPNIYPNESESIRINPNSV